MTRPYLDVMTVSSAQYPTAFARQQHFESHKLLLVEPVSVPNLEHTGVSVRLPLHY